jgi:uncharacterized lipoprotein YmbA
VSPSKTPTLAILTAVALAAGCSSLPPTHYYVIELEPAAEAPSSGAGGGTGGDAGGWTIGVRPFLVDAPYDQDRIVYRVGERSPEVGFYAYHLWAAPLQSMLPAVVAAGLSGAAGVREIEPVDPGQRYRAHLLGRVLAVEEVDLADRQLVRASIELRLVGADGAELWADRVEARGETTAGGVPAIVEGLAQALGRALAASRGRLGDAVSALR